MFDFHMHSRVSFDSKADPLDMLAAAERAGLREICFTDHMDSDPSGGADLAFCPEAYRQAYDSLPESPVTVRLGMEFGLLPDNRSVFLEEAKKRPYDFIIGSVHFAAGLDPYRPAYWQGRSQEEAYECYLQAILECLQTHRDFSVLGHLTYPTKASANPSPRPYTMARYGDLAEEIFRKLIDLGIGLEVNTSGLRVGNEPLPPLEFVRRYVELGGEILTIGSDAHVPQRVGQYIPPDAGRIGEDHPLDLHLPGGQAPIPQNLTRLQQRLLQIRRSRSAYQKSLTEFAAAAANKVKIMFSRDMCAGKHTAQAATPLSKSPVRGFSTVWPLCVIPFLCGEWPGCQTAAIPSQTAAQSSPCSRAPAC